MKEYTGDKLFRAQKVIASLKEAFEYEKELYKELFGNLTIKKYRKNDDETHELVYVGDIDGIGLQFTVLFNKHLVNVGYDAQFENGEHLRLINKDNPSYASADLYTSESERELPWGWNVEHIETEMLKWLHWVNAKDQGRPMRLVDWANNNKELFNKFNEARNDIEHRKIETLRYDPLYQHFRKETWDTCDITALAGIDEQNKPYIAVWIHYTANDEKDDYCDRVIYGGRKDECVRNLHRNNSFYGVKFYDIDEMYQFVKDAQLRVEAEQDRMAKEHGIEWRGIKFNDKGPVGEHSVFNKFAKSATEKILDMIEKRTFNFRTFVGKEDLVKEYPEDHVYEGAGALYEKKVSMMKKKGQKLVPFNATISIRPDAHFYIYGYDKFILKGDEHDVYDVNVFITLPLRYITLDGEYMTFDEAKEHSDGGPIKVKWRKYQTSFKTLSEKYWKAHGEEDNAIARKIMDEYPGGQGIEAYEAWCEEHYPGYVHRKENYVLGILNNYVDQYNKYLEYSKEFNG